MFNKVENLVNQALNEPVRPYPRVLTAVFDGSDKDKDRTRQEFKESCDINNIVNSWKQMGYNPDTMHQDVADIFDSVVEDARIEAGAYQAHLNAVAAARDAFMRLPANVRERFGNNPQKLLNFVSNEENRLEAEKLGLVVKKQVVKPAEAVAPQGMQAGEAGGSEGAK